MNTPFLNRLNQLEAEIQIRHEEMETIRNSALTETLFKGLALAGALGAWLDVENCHENCLSGELTASKTANDGYELQKLFKLEGYHDMLSIDIEGFERISVSANDGTLTVNISHANDHTIDTITNIPARRAMLKQTYPAKLAAAKAFLAKYGVSLKTDRLEAERKSLTTQLEKLNYTIGLIQS